MILPPTTRSRGNLYKLIRSIQLDGLIEPITVSPAGRFWRIVQGSQRYRAIKTLIKNNALVWDLEAQQEQPAKDVYRYLDVEMVEAR